MTDIVERLRKYPKPERCNNIFRKTSENAHEAADEIERLRAALRPFAEESKRFDEGCAHFNHPLMPDDHQPRTHFTHGQLRAARAALEDKP